MPELKLKYFVLKLHNLTDIITLEKELKKYRELGFKKLKNTVIANLLLKSEIKKEKIKND